MNVISIGPKTVVRVEKACEPTNPNLPLSLSLYLYNNFQRYVLRDGSTGVTGKAIKVGQEFHR